MIASAVVVVAIVVAATLILLDSGSNGTADPGPTTPTVPSGSTTSTTFASTSTAGVRPFPPPTELTTPDESTTAETTTADTAERSTDDRTTDATTDNSSTDESSTDETTDDSTTVTSGTSAANAAARTVADAWVVAINKEESEIARDLSCSAIQSKITDDFVSGVNGSIKITSLTTTGGDGVLRFTYKKKTDTATRSDKLTMVLSSGDWKVCS